MRSDRGLLLVFVSMWNWPVPSGTVEGREDIGISKKVEAVLHAGQGARVLLSDVV